MEGHCGLRGPGQAFGLKYPEGSAGVGKDLRPSAGLRATRACGRNRAAGGGSARQRMLPVKVASAAWRGKATGRPGALKPGPSCPPEEGRLRQSLGSWM